MIVIGEFIDAICSIVAVVAMVIWGHVTSRTFLTLVGTSLPATLMVVTTGRRAKNHYATKLLDLEGVLRRRCLTVYRELLGSSMQRSSGDAIDSQMGMHGAEPSDELLGYQEVELDIFQDDHGYLSSVNSLKGSLKNLEDSDLDTLQGDQDYLNSVNAFLDDLDETTADESEQESNNEVHIHNEDYGNMSTRVGINQKRNSHNGEVLENSLELKNKTTNAEYSNIVDSIEEDVAHKHALKHQPDFDGVKFTESQLSYRTMERLKELEMLSKSVSDVTILPSVNASISSLTNGDKDGLTRYDIQCSGETTIENLDDKCRCDFIAMENASYDTVFGINMPNKIENSTMEDRNRMLRKRRTSNNSNTKLCESDEDTIYKTIHTGPIPSYVDEHDSLSPDRSLEMNSTTKFSDCMENSLADNTTFSSISYNDKSTAKHRVNKHPIINPSSGDVSKCEMGKKGANKKHLLDKTEESSLFRSLGMERVMENTSKVLDSRSKHKVVKSSNISQEVITAIKAIEVLTKPGSNLNLDLQTLIKNDDVLQEMRETQTKNTECGEKPSVCDQNSNRNLVDPHISRDNENGPLNDIVNMVNSTPIAENDNCVGYRSEYMHQFSKEIENKCELADKKTIKSSEIEGSDINDDIAGSHQKYSILKFSKNVNNQLASGNRNEDVYNDNNPTNQIIDQKPIFRSNYTRKIVPMPIIGGITYAGIDGRSNVNFKKTKFPEYDRYGTIPQQPSLVESEYLRPFHVSYRSYITPSNIIHYESDHKISSFGDQRYTGAIYERNDRNMNFFQDINNNNKSQTFDRETRSSVGERHDKEIISNLKLILNHKNGNLIKNLLLKYKY